MRWLELFGGWNKCGGWNRWENWKNYNARVDGEAEVMWRLE
jgi:hypothetical protein